MKRTFWVGISILIAFILLLSVFKAASTAALSITPQPPSPQARIHPDLLKTLEASQPGDLLSVIVQWQRDPLLATSAAQGMPDELSRRTAVVSALQMDRQQATASLRAVIDRYIASGQAADIRYYWVSPVISLRAAPALIWELAAQDGVVQIRPDRQILLEDPAGGLVQAPHQGGLLPNLEMINAGLANEALGLDGTGVVVANLDTGVDWQHPALLQKYRGYNPNGPAIHFGNWHDSTDGGYLYPGDGNGHGTHTMGTMVGDDGLGNRTGVAPGASWIAVKVFNNQGSTYESWIHDAFEWILAPEGEPSLAPDVINNSWGSSNGSDETFRPDIEALKAAGIIPVFSPGNSGPQPGSVQSPASLPGVISTGALDEEKVVATFSARGPSEWGEIKPAFSAPGVNVLSTYPGGSYAYGNGTSMASPHTAGTIALLLQAQPDLQEADIVALLKDTAEPLGDEHPNNDTGWGLINAYAAGMELTASGEISGSVHAGELALPYPTITVTLRGGSPSVTISGDEMGQYRLALLPGLYDVTASAFGYTSQIQYGINIVEAALVTVNFDLPQAPSGMIHGTVTDLRSGSPLSATLTVLGTPFRVPANPLTGEYSLWLPAGTWTIEAESREHRIVRVVQVVEAGYIYPVDFSLPSAPSILLVDSGRWYYGSQIDYYEDALHELGYSYDLHPIRSILDPNLPDDRPISTTLLAYDIVIWSSPGDSPGLIYAHDALRGYLAGGGQLLISGEDVAFWDGGGTLFGRPSAYLINQTSVLFDSQEEEANLTGAAGSPLDGLEVLLNTPDSAQGSTHPDAGTIQNPLLAQPALLKQDGTTAAVTAGTCTPYKSAWLGFGFENAGPRPTRLELLARLFEWFDAPPLLYDLSLDSPPGPLIGPPGSIVTWTLILNSTGIETDTIQLNLSEGPFPVEVATPFGSFSGSTQITLGGCNQIPITATFTLTNGLPGDMSGLYILSAASLGDPAQVVSATMIVKTPASVLVVDAENWYNHLDAYTTALDNLGVSYDIFDSYNLTTVPTITTLQSYPLVLWVTGYNWAWPLDSLREARLEAYLDSGGRLLLTSQDALDLVGADEFMVSRMGVRGAALSVGSEDVLPTANSPFADDEGVWGLNYPFPNWSDALLPGHDALPVMQDTRGNINGLFHDNDTWRTAFYAFPLEALPPETLENVLASSLLWISPMGNSYLDAPPAAAASSQITVTLALQLAGAPAAEGYQASLPIPEGLSFVPDSITGDWFYSQEHNALEYQGDMCPI